MSVVDACPALRLKPRRDSRCFDHILGATDREQLRVCRESCVYGRGLAMSAEVPVTVLPEFVPLRVDYGQEAQPREHFAMAGVNPVELLGQLLKAAKAKPVRKMVPAVPMPSSESCLSPKTNLLHPGCPEDAMVKDYPTVPVTCEPARVKRGPGRPRGTKNVSNPAPAPAPRAPVFLVVSALASAVASYPPQMKRTKALILRKRYNHAAGSGHKYHSYNDFLRDLGMAGICIVRDKHRVQASWVLLDDAMQRLISTSQKRAA